MKKTMKELNVHYYTGIAVLGILFLSAIFVPIRFDAAFHVTVTAEMYAIGLTLLAIPAALKLFADRIKKIPKGVDEKRAAKLYKNAFILRLYIVIAVTLANILLYTVSRNNSFMWFTVVLFVVFVFCKPAIGELENIAKKDEVSNNPTSA